MLSREVLGVLLLQIRSEFDLAGFFFLADWLNLFGHGSERTSFASRLFICPLPVYTLRAGRLGGTEI